MEQFEKAIPFVDRAILIGNEQKGLIKNLIK